MQEKCAQYFVVEYDGGVYPCDFFVKEDLLLGNIKTHNWEQIFDSKIFQDFGTQKMDWNPECSFCPYLSLCHGDCQKFRGNLQNKSNQISTLCKGWKIFYTRTLPKFISIAEEFKVKNRINSPALFKLKKVGRNETCPCGSGIKYKNCCDKPS
jgi:uncharacterized protein